MELPHSTDLNEFNRLLITIAALSEEDKGCSLGSARALCSSLVLGGSPFDHRKILKLCSYAGLLSIGKGKLKLTELGKQFLHHNPNSYYEITEAQKIFVTEQLIFAGPWQSKVRDLFLCFSPNYSEITYELSQIENPLPLRYNTAIYLLRVLGVLVEVDGKLIVTPRYVGLVNQIIADRHTISDEKLEQALQVDWKIAAQAEEAVVEYERKRLKGVGRTAEANLVRRISQLDIGAGYDVESFEGDKPLFDYDRFIEVKASQESELRFYWSANERRVAKEKGDTYWIYFLGGFRRNKASQITPIMIQNPANRLPQISQVRVEAATYVVTQCGELPLKVVYQKNVKGLLL